MKFWVKIEDAEKTVEVEQQDGTYVVTIDGDARIVDCRNVGHKDYLSLLIENKSYLVETAPIRADEGRYYASINGHRYEVDVFDERLRAARAAGATVQQTGPYILASPMPGLIVDVRVKVGEPVKAGTAIVVMEAMKMQNELIAEVDGIVTAINIAPKDAVDSQTPLVEIERAE